MNSFHTFSGANTWNVSLQVVVDEAALKIYLLAPENVTALAVTCSVAEEEEEDHVFIYLIYSDFKNFTLFIFVYFFQFLILFTS